MFILLDLIDASKDSSSLLLLSHNLITTEHRDIIMHTARLSFLCSVITVSVFIKGKHPWTYWIKTPHNFKFCLIILGLEKSVITAGVLTENLAEDTVSLYFLTTIPPRNKIWLTLNIISDYNNLSISWKTDCFADKMCYIFRLVEHVTDTFKVNGSIPLGPWTHTKKWKRSWYFKALKIKVPTKWHMFPYKYKLRGSAERKVTAIMFWTT